MADFNLATVFTPADTTLEVQRVSKKSTFLKWGLGIAGVLLIGPFAWWLAYSLLGIAAAGVAAGVAGAVGLAWVYGSEVVVMKLKNRQIMAIQAEATKNPIPTLWSVHEAEKNELAQVRALVVSFAAEIENVRSKADSLDGQLTKEDIDAFRADADLMEVDLRAQEEAYDEAVRGLEDFRLQIVRAAAIWDMNMAMAKANAFSQKRAMDTLQQLKRDTALDSCVRRMNTSKAELRMRVRARHHSSSVVESLPAPAASGEVLDFTPATSPVLRKA